MTTLHPDLVSMGEEVQDPDPTSHLHPGLDLHGGPDSESTPTPTANTTCTYDVWVRGPYDAHRLGSRQEEGLNGEGGSHVLGAARVDPAGRDEHEPDLAAGVEELEGAVVVGEGGPVGVADGDVLGEGEVDGAVGDGEGGELDGVDRDLGVVGLEDGEIDDEDDDDDEN
ncbi:hypothetical protein CJ030_MR1G007506 [Morella rubra]|uniref:Uncharacterized protein n=1 Tax=Morella rubra TaxID=262757 RepID=A0A6A1WNG6_9ROSI|nr:hypothetical protein CJ030_MR1G007506 [Morella rubra]